MPVSKYGFPRKIKIVNRKPGRPKKPRALMKENVYEAFCEWSAKPTPLKEIKLLRDWAKKWGVSPDTLTRWKNRQDFWEKVAEWRINWARDKTSDVVNGLYKRAATRGEASEVKLWMQLIEDWSEKVTPVKQDITIVGIRGITKEDLDRLKQPPEQNAIDAEDAEIVVED